MYHRFPVGFLPEPESRTREPATPPRRPPPPAATLLSSSRPGSRNGNRIVNENVIDVLIYIYENYMDSDEQAAPDQVMLEEELVEAGFPKGEIKKAFDWLDELAWRQGSMLVPATAANRSIRIYTDLERQRLDLETQGMLLYLEQSGILDQRSRELVIERAMALESEELTAEDVKWIVLLVLLNQPGQESAYALMEELVYNGDPGYLH